MNNHLKCNTPRQTIVVPPGEGARRALDIFCNVTMCEHRPKCGTLIRGNKQQIEYLFHENLAKTKSLKKKKIMGDHKNFENP